MNNAPAICDDRGVMLRTLATMRLLPDIVQVVMM